MRWLALHILIVSQEDTAATRAAQMTATIGRYQILLTVVLCYAFGALVLWVSRRADVSQSVHLRQSGIGRKMAVIVPIHDGDKFRAMDAISRWPHKCQRNIVEHMDLIIYKAEPPQPGPDGDAFLLSKVPHEASACFRSTKIVSANLLPEVGPATLAFFDARRGMGRTRRPRHGYSRNRMRKGSPDLKYRYGDT